MPATRRKQSNAMLYTLIFFVGLCIVAIVVAVFYYVKAEEHRNVREQLKSDLEKYASEDEQGEVGSVVGSPINRSTSYLGTMIKHLDDAVCLIVGGEPESTSAEVKVNDAKSKAASMLKESEPYIGYRDPNLTGLTQVITALTQKLQQTIDSKAQAQKTLETTIADFKKTQDTNLEAYQTLLEEKDKLRKDFNDVKRDYDELYDLQKKTTDEQVLSLQDQLDREKANLRTVNDQLLEKQAILSETQNMLAAAKEALAEYGKPRQDSMAYIPDGKILSVDNEAKIAYINLGSNDHVYRGLTFAIYDKGAYIGEEGQDKAEIEIFDIADTYSAARIIKSALNRPILKGDAAANLIWDKKKINEFVIAGDFDLNDDGYSDFDAAAKIKAVIERWGGKVTDKISIETDYLILGEQPQIPEQKPTLEEQEMDPTALQRYEVALEKLNRYNDLENRAISLWIPIFTYEKFLHLIGYTAKTGQAGAF